MYKKTVDELKLLGILPRKRGRPAMYGHGEALDINRDRAREYAMLSRTAKHISQLIEHDNTSKSSREESDGRNN